jgi:hypothetical protein
MVEFLEECERIFNDAWTETVKKGLSAKPPLDDPELQKLIKKQSTVKPKVTDMFSRLNSQQNLQIQI